MLANGQSASIARQGQRIGHKALYQRNYWADSENTEKYGNSNIGELLPKSPNNTLVLIDNFDVPSSEKAFMTHSILKGLKNSPGISIIFLNNK